MLISEIFHSLQGEGRLTGVPSVFIRTSGCNLRCAWCDTPYASWTPEGREMSPQEILDTISTFPSRHVVLTGGEPMIARGVTDLLALLENAGRHITIETAGTIPPAGPDMPCHLASLSPKLAHSAPAPGSIDPAWIDRHERTRLQPAVLAQWISHFPFQLKFVLSSPGDLGEIKNLLSELPPVPPSSIHLMPEGISTDTLDSRSPWLIDLCKEHGFRYCDRLHLRLFGNKRGT